MRNKRNGLNQLLGVCLTSLGVCMAGPALALDGVMHIVGEITAPSCNISAQAVVHMQQQMNPVVTRQACAKSATSAMATSSNFAVALIESNTTLSKQDAASDKQMLTLTYR
jgi:hypothetical protein